MIDHPRAPVKEYTVFYVGTTEGFASKLNRFADAGWVFNSVLWDSHTFNGRATVHEYLVLVERDA